jgi:hypothetical protein
MDRERLKYDMSEIGNKGGEIRTMSECAASPTRIMVPD